MLSFICPHDKHVLEEKDSGLFCAECERQYPVQDGVVCTLDQPDEFYEGTYENQVRFIPQGENPWQVWPLWLINGGYLWSVRHHIPQGATVVELGCAGGVKYFGQRYHMIGCDLSLASLKKTDFYAQRVQGDAAVCIPLPDSSVDAVVSSYFWEHIPPNVKPEILKECQRILKPGGKIVFLYDIETNNPLIRRYKEKDSALYKKLFIDGDGHVGYQWPAENIEIFKSGGFHVLEHKGMEKTWLQSPSAYVKLAAFGGSMQNFFTGLSCLGGQPWFYPYTALMRLVDTVVCPWLPADWARIELVVCEKK